MKRVRVIAFFGLIASILGLIGYAKPQAFFYVFTTVKKNAPAHSFPVPNPVQAQPQQVSITTLAGLGTPIRFSAVSAINDKGASTLSYTLTNADTITIREVNLVLFDFNSMGELMKVQAWNLRTTLKTGDVKPFSLQLKHRATLGDSLVLTAHFIVGETAHWKANFGELANAAATLITGTKPVVTVVKTNQAFTESSGADFCTAIFSKAFRLSKMGDKKRLTSFVCDREQRQAAFGFNAKSLSQP